jgi:hypothetical protein
LNSKHFHRGWTRKPHEHTPNSEIGRVSGVLCHEGWPLRQKGLPFCFTETKTAQGTAAGSAPQALTKGPQNTRSRPSCGLSSPKTVTLPKGLPRLSERLAARSNVQKFFTPTHVRRVPPFSRQRFVAKFATHGNAFWRRPRTMLATCNAVDRPGTLFSPSITGS